MCKVYVSEGKYFMEDNGQVVELKTMLTHGKLEVKLPENSANRQFIMCHKIDQLGEIILEPKTSDPRVLPKGISVKALDEYMTDEERKIVEEIREKCKARAEAAKAEKKDENDKAKLLAKIAKYQAELEQLTKGSN